MDDIDHHWANNHTGSGTAGARPGPPKGVAKPAGSGRKPGTPNRATADVRAAAQKYSAKAIRTLVQLLEDPDPKVKAIAAREILDRAHGKPMTPSEITGAGGAPFIPTRDFSDIEQARRLSFLLAKGARAGDPGAVEMLAQANAKREARDAVRPAARHSPPARLPPSQPAYDPPPRDPEAIARMEADMHLTRHTDAIIEASRRRGAVVRLNPNR